MERFEQFQFSVLTVPLGKGFLRIFLPLRFWFRFLKNGSSSVFWLLDSEIRFQRFRVSVLVRFLDHPVNQRTTKGMENSSDGKPVHVSGVSCALASGKEKAHKHKQIFPVTARAGGGLPTGWGGSPDRWPGVRSLCAVCGTQGT